MIHVPRLKAVVYVRYRVTRDGSIHSRRRAASISLKLGAVHEKHSVYTSVQISQDKHWCRLDWDCVECDGSAETSRGIGPTRAGEIAPGPASFIQPQATSARDSLAHSKQKRMLKSTAFWRKRPTDPLRGTVMMG